ncbi:MAG: alanine racemase [Myxococcota bacterium]|nr:alanine racemase [Myxococcota bacterium]
MNLLTPCLLLDRARLEANCARMRAAVARHGVRLRPHVKTAKCVEVAEAALGDAPFRGLTVSTLAEARRFREAGFEDLVYAVGITPQKLPAARALGLQVLTDEPDVAAAIAEAGLDAWLEVDCGLDRGGRAPGDPALVEAARALGPRLRGVLTHGGQSYACRTPEAMRQVAEEERRAAVEAAARIRAAGVPCPEVSVGSTPTALHAERLDGVTEVRAGVHVFFDLFQHAIGSCARDELALSVLASVISRRPDGSVWIDAGTLALSSERSLDAVGGAGFGEVTTLDGARLGRVVSTHQEHGRVVGAAPLALSVGDQVRVWPNHACITAAMHDRYHVIEGGEVVREWARLPG